MQSNLDIQRAIDGEINVTQSGYPVDFENEEAERTEARERPFSAASLLLAAACFSDNASSPEPDWYGGAWYNANRSNCRHFYLKSVTSPPLYFEGFENACLMFGGTPSELFEVSPQSQGSYNALEKRCEGITRDTELPDVTPSVDATVLSEACIKDHGIPRPAENPVHCLMLGVDTDLRDEMTSIRGGLPPSELNRKENNLDQLWTIYKVWQVAKNKPRNFLRACNNLGKSFFVTRGTANIYDFDGTATRRMAARCITIND